MSNNEDITNAVSNGIIRFSVWLSSVLDPFKKKFNYFDNIRIAANEQEEINEKHRLLVNEIMDKLVFAGCEIVKLGNKDMFTALLNKENFSGIYKMIEFRFAYIRYLIRAICKIDFTTDRYFLNTLCNIKYEEKCYREASFITKSVFVTGDIEHYFFSPFYDFKIGTNAHERGRIVVKQIINDAMDSNEKSLNFIIDKMISHTKNDYIYKYIVDVILDRNFKGITLINYFFNTLEDSLKIKLLRRVIEKPISESDFVFLINSIETTFLKQHCVTIIKDMKEPYITLLSERIEGTITPPPTNSRIIGMYNSLTMDEKKEMLRLISNDL